MLGDRWPGCHGAAYRLYGADHVGDDHRRRAEAVVCDLPDKAAEAVQEARQLRYCLMEHARAPPPRAAVDGLITIGGLDLFELRGHQVERLVPWHSDERLTAAPRTVAVCAVREPALAHHRPLNTAWG